MAATARLMLEHQRKISGATPKHHEHSLDDDQMVRLSSPLSDCDVVLSEI